MSPLRKQEGSGRIYFAWQEHNSFCSNCLPAQLFASSGWQLLIAAHKASWTETACCSGMNWELVAQSTYPALWSMPRHLGVGEGSTKALVWSPWKIPANPPTHQKFHQQSLGPPKCVWPTKCSHLQNLVGQCSIEGKDSDGGNLTHYLQSDQWNVMHKTNHFSAVIFLMNKCSR